MLYQAYILPVLEYCDTVWSPTSIHRLNRLHSKFTSSSNNFNLRSTLTFHTVLQVYVIVNRSLLHIYMEFSLMLWMSQVALVEMYTDFLFLVRGLIMVSSHWCLGAQPFGTVHLKQLYGAKTVDELYCVM